MLDLWQTDLQSSLKPRAYEGKDLPATFGETVQDAWSNGQLASSGIKQFNAQQQALNEYMDTVKQAGGNVDAAFTDDSLRHEDTLGVINSVVAGLRGKGGTLPFQPKTQADIDARAVEISQGAIKAHAQMGQREQTWGSWAGNLVGSVGSTFADPYNIPLMAIPLEGVGVIGTAARVGGGMAATQLANEATNAGFNEKVQPGYADSGQALNNIAGAAVGGALLGGGGALLGKGIEALAGRFGTAARDQGNILSSEANIAETNPLPGIQGEAAHPAALGKAIDDVLNEKPVDVSQQVGALEPKPSTDLTTGEAAPAAAVPSEPPPSRAEIAAEPQPAVHPPGTMAEKLDQPETHDAIRADIERAIDEAAKNGKALQIPIGKDENGEAIMGSATRALTEIDQRNALADAIAQCALPMAAQAGE